MRIGCPLVGNQNLLQPRTTLGKELLALPRLRCLLQQGIKDGRRTEQELQPGSLWRLLVELRLAFFEHGTKRFMADVVRGGGGGALPADLKIRNHAPG